MSELNVNITNVEASLQKLDLKKGEVLLMTFQSSKLDDGALQSIANLFRKLLPENRVAVLNLHEGDSVALNVVSAADVPLEATLDEAKA